MARQNFVGLVVSQGKMAKTVKVRVQSKGYDKKVHKEIFKRKDYLVHDEGNISKEGDIVRIEAIPKISARKYFAIAEIKVNKGQQFALYETVAKEKVQKENEEKIQEFINRRKEIDSVIAQVEDLKLLDQLTNNYKSDPSAREQLVSEINKIKEKYNIPSWPTTEPVLNLELNQKAEDLSVEQRRLQHIKAILDKLMSDEYKSEREAILSTSKTPVDQLQPFTMKNLLRKFVLNPRNKCPVSVEGISFN